VDAYFQMYNSYLKLQNSGQALLTLRNLITVSTDQQIIDEAYYQMGWTYVDLANWEKARLSFNKIHPQNQKRYHLKKIGTELDKEKLLLRKNPNLAGVLSVFPGAGYIYSHRYKDAFIAFLLNSALALAAYKSFDDENYALGGLLSMVGFGFYGGSIFGSVASAHKYNQGQTRQFIENMKRNLKIGLVGSSQNKGLALSVRYLF
jgi:tetratricopeptide (TPR) repeat protein